MRVMIRDLDSRVDLVRDVAVLNLEVVFLMLDILRVYIFSLKVDQFRKLFR